MKRIALILAVLLTGCGAAADAARALDTPAGTPTPTPSPMPTATPASDMKTLEHVAPKASASPGACTVSTGNVQAVTVAVSVVLPDATSQVVWSSVLRTWKDAVQATPAGHHLATRAEVMALFDAGWFHDTPNDFPFYAFWTSTEVPGVAATAWTFDATNSGEVKPQLENDSLPAIYVPNGGAK